MYVAPERGQITQADKSFDHIKKLMLFRKLCCYKFKKNHITLNPDLILLLLLLFYTFSAGVRADNPGGHNSASQLP